MQSDTSNYKGLAWANTSDESIAGIGYHNTAQAIYINAIGASSVYSDAAGKYSLKVGNDVLTYNTKVILREDNYATYLDTAYLPLAGGKNITGNFSMSAGVMVFINSTSGNALLGTDNSSNGLFGVYNTTTYIRSGSYDLFHKKFSGSTPTDYKIWDGSNSGTTSKAWEASTLLAATRATVGSSTLDTDNVLSVTGTAKITGALALGNSSSANLNFQRGGANYITAPSGGSIYFIPDGGATQLANSPLIVGASSIYAGKTNTDLGTSTYYWRYAYISRVYLAGGAYLEYNSNGYIYISKPIVTEGDQIVISGTPGGGGGGTIPYLYELQDVTITNIGTGNLLQWNGSAWVNVAASSVGVTSVATQSANGLMSSTDKTKLDGIATGANNYTLPAATSGALGGIKIGYTDSTAGTRNYAVQLSNDKAYVNVPWDNTTYSLLTSSANGLAPAFSTANKATSASTNSYHFLGWTGSTMKWYTLPANAFSDTTYSAATQSAAGLMSSADKTKLDGIATGATAVTDSTVSGWGYLKTDEKVKQTATTTSAAYEILFSESANNTTATEGARKTSTLTYNPSTKALSTGGAVNGLTLTAATTGFTIAGGTTSKTLTVNETGTAVLLTATQALTNKTYNGYTLRDACAKGYTDSTSASAIGTDTALVTERDVYYGLPTINNAHNYTSSTTIYAPTGAGTSGYWLKASGSNTAPTWEATSNMEAGKVTTAADTTNALYVVGVTSGATSTLKRDTSVTITGGAVSATSLTLAGAISGATNIDSLIYCDTTNSRVGIGQRSPTQALDVNGNAYIKGFVRLANNNNINIMTANGAYAAQMVGFDSSNINHLCYGGSGGVYETRIYGNVIKFYNNSRTQVASISTAGLLTTSGDQVVSSDASLKKDWRPLNYGIADIAKATAGVFTWKDGRGISAGTKAQDWEKLVPQLVHGDEGHKTLAYGQVAMLNTILLARGYESHEERIKRLEAENMELKKEIEQLRAN